MDAILELFVQRALARFVWSPGFSRRDVGSFDDCEMFKAFDNVAGLKPGLHTHCTLGHAKHP